MKGKHVEQSYHKTW